jgi:hypothetical protein
MLAEYERLDLQHGPLRPDRHHRPTDLLGNHLVRVGAEQFEFILRPCSTTAK